MKMKRYINSAKFMYFQQNLEYISLSLFIASSSIIYFLTPENKSLWYFPFFFGILYAIGYALKIIIYFSSSEEPLYNLPLIFPELSKEREDVDVIKNELLTENESLLIELNKLEGELILLKN